MYKKLLTILGTLLLSVTFINPIYLVNSENHIVYDPVNNKCTLSPSGSDDTTILREAFSLVIAGGPGAEVYLKEGNYIITDNIIDRYGKTFSVEAVRVS